MDLGRFHRGIEQLDAYYKRATVSEVIGQLASELSALGATSTTPEAAQAFRKRLETSSETIRGPGEELLGGPALEVIEALGLQQTVGEGLNITIVDTIAENQLSPSLASQALLILKTSTDKTINHVAHINAAFTELKVEYEDIEDGESELQLSIPAERDEKTLVDLAKEAKDWNFVLGTLSEVFDADHPVAKVRTIASGSWLIYLSSTPVVLWGVANALKQVNKILSELVTLRKQIEQLIYMKAPTKELETYQKNKLAVDTETLAKTLVDENYAGKDAARKQELMNATSQALKTLTRKLATGSKVRMRIGAVPKPTVENPEAPSPQEKQLIKQAEEFATQKSKAESEIALIESSETGPEIVNLLPAPTDIP